MTQEKTDKVEKPVQQEERTAEEDSYIHALVDEIIEKQCQYLHK